MNPRFRLQTSWYSLCVVVLFLLAGVLQLKAQGDSVTQVRAVHLVSDAPAVDAYIDDVSPASIPNKSYLDASRALSLKPGTRNIKIAASGTPKEAAVINQDIAFNHDTAYTIFATGRLSLLDVQPVVLTRNLQLQPTPGRTLVRFLHASTSSGPLNVKIFDAINAETSLQDVAFRSSSNYAALSAGDLQVEVTTSGGEVLYKASGITPAGAVITLIAVGEPIDGTFKISVLVDSDPVARSPMDTLRRVIDNPSGRLRFVHVSPDANNVDVFFGENTDLLGSLQFRNATRVDELSGGTYTVKVAPQGAGAGSAFIEKQVEVISSLYRAAVIVGSRTDETTDIILLTADASATPAAGRSSIRVLNASTDLGVVDIEITYSNATKRQIASSSFRNFTPYEGAAPGNATIRVTPNGETTPVFVATGSIPPNIIGTLILTGKFEDKSLGFNLLIDSENGAQEPMMLFDGMIGVENERSIVSRMDVLPNPVKDQMTLRFGTLQPTKLNYTLYTIEGKAVRHGNLGLLGTGDHRVRIEVEEVPSGSYFVVVYNEAGQSLGMQHVQVL